ncbi:MAG: hypothetical protein ACYSUD_09360 [Planctomycetota bacterium]|jgi:hypothetical protein
MGNTADNRTKTKKEHARKLPEVKRAAEEQECLAKHRERSRTKPLKFRDTKTESGSPRITPEDVSLDVALAKMTDALGTADLGLQNYLLQQIAPLYRGFADREQYHHEKMAMFCNIAMAILSGIQPQDEIEGMLAVQMIGTHNMAMETLERAMLTGQTDIGKDLNAKQAAKMMRVFVAQMEALKKYRTGGQQKMTVKHVHVNEGGQAIVGTVNQGVVKKDG